MIITRIKRFLVARDLGDTKSVVSDLRQPILLPQFLQNFASIGFDAPQETQTVESNKAPHLMQCFAPLRICAPHFPHHPAPRAEVSAGLVGANELGENTSDKMTTSPTVATWS